MILLWLVIVLLVFVCGVGMFVFNYWLRGDDICDIIWRFKECLEI